MRICLVILNMLMCSKAAKNQRTKEERIRGGVEKTEELGLGLREEKRKHEKEFSFQKFKINHIFFFVS